MRQKPALSGADDMKITDKTGRTNPPVAPRFELLRYAHIQRFFEVSSFQWPAGSI